MKRLIPALLLPFFFQTSEVRLTLTEGTSMAASVSPDGKTIVIDLLGVLWVLPAAGGAATRITDDFADARQPVWSPDGRSIAFQSFRDGTWHIWSVQPDGSGLKQLTSGPYDHREPSFSHDGTRLAFSSDRSGNYDIWELDLRTGGSIPRTTNAANDFGPAWSPDDREIAFVTEGGISAVNTQGQQRRLQEVTGAVNAPSWSPDGKQILYTVSANNQSRLFVSGRAITSGEDVFPFRAKWISAMDFIYTADGKIKKRSLVTNTAVNIEFHAAIAFTRPSYQQKRKDFDSAANRPALGIVKPAISPDGKQVAFSALGDIWIMPIGAAARRITNDKYFDIDVAWAPDGRTLSYSSDRAGTMDIWTRDLQTGEERRVTTAPGAELGGSWSPEGTRIAHLDEQGQLFVVNVESGTSQRIRGPLFQPGRPTWSKDGRTIAMGALRPYSTRYREGTSQILAVSLVDNTDRYLAPVPHESIGTRENDGPVWSPDGRQLAFVVDGTLWAMPVNSVGNAAGPPRQLTKEMVDSPSWTGDSRQLLYMSNDRLRLVAADGGTSRDVPLNLTWAPKQPAGRLVIHASRLFDGKNATLRNNVDVVIEGNRIRSVNDHRAELHNGKIIDAGNTTVMPGLIEMHTHLNEAYGERLGRILLAYGITSVRNPAAAPYMAAEAREAIESGVRIGPRVFATGYTFDGNRIYYSGSLGIDSEAQLNLQMERARRLNFDLVKTYVRLPDRLQKLVIDAAHRNGMPVTSHELYPAVAFGADGVEHIAGTSRRGYSPKVTSTGHSYSDVIDLLTRAKMTITPTIAISGGFIYTALKDPTLLEDERFTRLFPVSVVESTKNNVSSARGADMNARAAALRPRLDTVLRVVRGGGRVIAGTDAPIFPFGLSLHSEIEQYVEAGLTPFEALRTATTWAADALGSGMDLGSIESGKLADLVFVNGNPLEDIRNARRVVRVMKNGEIYELSDLLR
ncbi:MAG: PD40 domain-containing protein [Acidobacteria bacterium]|nr:PD40 domain-containing protein [Acidobacteriota bacterium]